MPRKPKTNLPLRPVIPRKAKTIAAKAKQLAEQSPKKVKLEKKYKEKPEGAVQSKPTYLKMIKAAIAANPDRKGTTDYAIISYIGANYPVYGNFQARVRVALRNGAEKGQLTCVNKRRWRVVKEAKKEKKEKSTPKKSPKKKSEKDSPKKSSKKTKKEKAEESEQSPTKVKKEKAKSTKKEVTKKDTKKKTTKKKEDSSKTRTSKKKAEKEKPSTKGRGVTKETKGKKKTRGSSSDNEDEEGDELVWVWQFLENDKRYHNYDPAASDVVEAVYQDYKKNPGQTDVRSVQSGQWHYMVDFREMTQQNILHEAHTKRKIRRFQIPASEKANGSKGYSP